MTDHKELAEKVAKRLCFVAGEASWEKFWEEMAHAVIDIVLEEAATKAEVYIAMGWRGDELPAAIRALKEKV